jgi:molecular chaperone GrpE
MNMSEKKEKKQTEIPIELDQNNVTEDSEKQKSEKADEDNDLSKKYLNMLQRLQAEFENYKRRVEKEKREYSTVAKSQLIVSLLPVIDDFNRMFDAQHQNNHETRSGTEIIYNKFMSILKDEGLETIESLGQEFNPQIHEAISVEPSEDHTHNKILEVLEKGYVFKSKLLRPVKVKVGQTKN